MCGSFAEQDRPFLGWGQLVLPPLVAGVFCAAFAFPISPLAVVFALVWAWRLCGEIAEWRYTVRWEASLSDEDAKPADHFVQHLRQAIFVVEATAIMLAALVPVLWPWLPSLGQEPTWWNFQRLRVGMTLEEVEAIMGTPTKDTEAAAVPIPPMGQSGLADYMKWRDGWLQKVSRVRVWDAKKRYVFYNHYDKAGRLAKMYLRDLDAD